MTDKFNFEAYQSDLGEEAAKLVLEKFHNLLLKKIPERNDQETPDYEIVDADGRTVAICEVKSCVDAIRPTDNAEEIDYQKLAELSLSRDKNHRSKLRKHHGKAVSQLDGYADLPTMVIFASFDMTDYLDMGQVLQEHHELYPDSPMADAYMLMKIHQGILPSKSFDIKDTVRIMHNTESGKNFSEKYLTLSEALNRVGILPMTFSSELDLEQFMRE